MKPTILEGDRVFVNKLAYDLKVPFTTLHLAKWANPSRGDIVVFFSPHDGTRLVKRVVGLPRDVMELRNEQLIINSHPADYAPLSAEISGQLPAAEQQQSIFATEHLPAHPHAVMARLLFQPGELSGRWSFRRAIIPVLARKCTILRGGSV